jgi:hypothetical protein
MPIFVKIFEIFQLLKWGKGRRTHWQHVDSKKTTFFLCRKKRKLKGKYALTESHVGIIDKMADINNMSTALPHLHNLDRFVLCVVAILCQG